MKYMVENLQQINNEIEMAAKKSCRESDNILLLAVTKTVDDDKINKALEFGITDIGENKVQEFTRKYDVFGDKVNMHIIGHLQRNKVKYIIDKVKLIHSVDSLRLAQKISEEALKRKTKVDILVQVNIAKDEAKYGIVEEDLEQFLYDIASLDGIHIKGLMTIVPYVENPEKNRPYFRRMHKLFIDIKAKNIDNIHMDTLSMGMSNDYIVAIEEGANLVRIGTKIFGKRNYNIK